MRRQQQAVQRFHEKCGAVINKTPTLPNVKTRQLRLRLISEELDELRHAFDKESIVEVADAIADLLYVVLGTAVSCGLDIEPIFDEVHFSNMSKFTDGHRREDGKWIKGPSYFPPRIEQIIEKQTL